MIDQRLVRVNLYNAAPQTLNRVKSHTADDVLLVIKQMII